MKRAIKYWNTYDGDNGGMTDGRGGWFRGELTREGEPETVLAELLERNPEGEYVFSHDESGQFQVYFSVWRVAGSGAAPQHVEVPWTLEDVGDSDVDLQSQEYVPEFAQPMARVAHAGTPGEFLCGARLGDVAEDGKVTCRVCVTLGRG